MEGKLRFGFFWFTRYPIFGTSSPEGASLSVTNIQYMCLRVIPSISTLRQSLFLGRCIVCAVKESVMFILIHGHFRSDHSNFDIYDIGGLETCLTVILIWNI